MDHSVIQLTQVLQKTETLYLQLLHLIDQEKQAAVAADPEQLAEVSSDKQAVICKLKPLDQELNRAIQQVAMALLIPRAELKLSVVAAKAPPPYDRQIEVLNTRLQSLIAQVQTANEECRLLMHHCLRLVRSKLGYFERWMGNSDVYASSGSIRGASVGGRVLRGVV